MFTPALRPALAILLLPAPVAGAALPVSAGCLIACDEDLTVDAATAMLEQELGTALPVGVRVTHALHGGFQDGFLQVRIEATQAGAEALLALMGLQPAAMPPATAPRFGASQADWWQPQSEAGLQEGAGKLGHYAATWVGVAVRPGPGGHVTLYLFAYET